MPGDAAGVQLLTKLRPHDEEDRHRERGWNLRGQTRPHPSGASRVKEQLPFKNLVEVLLECSPPGVSDGQLFRREAFIEVDAVALSQKLDNELAIADAFAIQLDPRVLTL